MNNPIPFNRPAWAGNETELIAEAFENGWVAGDGPFTKRVQAMLELQLIDTEKVLLTTSCTHALEIAAILLDLQPGDEVIVPSYTFVSTALAFLMHGAIPVFADIRPDTLNMDETKLEALITDNTRAIVPVHYAGVGCEMDAIMAIAKAHNLIVIEDNAHGLYAKYRGRHLGTIGHMATQSFHETKNITCGEGGALIINDPTYIERAEIIREKGTNRARFFRGQIDKYTWVDRGSSYVISDILSAFLFGQLSHVDSIQARRKQVWENYREGLTDWATARRIGMPTIPAHCEQAYHMFYLLMPSLEARSAFIQHLKAQQISAVFHYLPLHDSDMGQAEGSAPLGCPVTRDVADRLVRLPFYTDMDEATQKRVIEVIKTFQTGR
ncbi:MAG: dTDP-4-amino-4,6-dideoxygalactose transaminase [endosymbiont of Seepiophila jonesi]|uniref:dTDP-4-amino-4,6-dideoxygalactose transaminase n=1 Tax=endosymbiont of Lamellibrachia luymesi TaxID=2200907 RepID=A0A370DYC0_9GAMM|nr:MAG: dTDP-4-amino-4,6-dideoxygalactose transaminase [endosymbiont of Lamellibrachia luymesi]RDH92721.1 MAG: dTDP-4-amino-4,6-dideoxygalactose transaminase [endosymbiont of Seepiophila jonesi]